MTGDDRRSAAFRLFEEGAYRESLASCRELSGNDPSMLILAAANHYLLGEHEQAELYFKDLSRQMPESSHVQSYLARILEQKGDPEAVRFYERAVLLDPGNQEALRGLARCLVGRNDSRKAIPLLDRLSRDSRNDDDIRLLMGALTAAGRASEAVTLAGRLSSPEPVSREYLDALDACGRFREAAALALTGFRSAKDPALYRRHLASLARADPDAAAAAYRSAAGDHGGDDLAGDFIAFLRSRGMDDEALRISERLVAGNPSPGNRLVLCEILASLRRREDAGAAYRALIRELMTTTADDRLLGTVLSSYTDFLLTHYLPGECSREFLSEMESGTHVECLLAAARFLELTGETADARSAYYRAYRTDYLRGGLEYARFLLRVRDHRESEKVLLYVLNNSRRTADIVRVGEVIGGFPDQAPLLGRFIERLLERLTERLADLSSAGLEVLSVALLVAATKAFEKGDYPRCKQFCLRGLDVIPPYAGSIGAGDFLSVLSRCKEKAVVESAMPHLHAGAGRPARPAAPEEQLRDLDERELLVIGFLRHHRQATETDLRALLGTRRVVGIMNQLIRKASSQGVDVIRKKGTGEKGEIYEYTG